MSSMRDRAATHIMNTAVISPGGITNGTNATAMAAHPTSGCRIRDRTIEMSVASRCVEMKGAKILQSS